MLPHQGFSLVPRLGVKSKHLESLVPSGWGLNIQRRLVVESPPCSAAVPFLSWLGLSGRISKRESGVEMPGPRSHMGNSHDPQPSLSMCPIQPPQGAPLVAEGLVRVQGLSLALAPSREVSKKQWQFLAAWTGSSSQTRSRGWAGLFKSHGGSPFLSTLSGTVLETLHA